MPLKWLQRKVYTHNYKLKYKLLKATLYFIHLNCKKKILITIIKLYLVLINLLIQVIRARFYLHDKTHKP